MELEVKEWSDEVLPPDSIVTGKLEEVKIETVEYTDKHGNPDSFDKAVWWWKITNDHRDGEFNGRKVKGECNPEISTHPNNKMRNWIEALLGRSLDAGMRISTDDLVGLTADISIINREAVVKGEDRIFMEVDEVMEASRGPSAGSTAPPSDDDVPFSSGRQGY